MVRTDFSQSFEVKEEASFMQPRHVGSGRSGRFNMLCVIYGVLIPIVMGYFLLDLEQETLFRIQELNLFLPTSLFWQGFAEYPGGALSWLGCFFTQFFHVPLYGVGLLVLFWIAIFFMVKSAFRVSSCWSVCIVLIPACLLVTVTEMGYFIYYIKLQGYFFTATVGFFMAVLSVLIFNKLSSSQVAGYIWMTVWTGAGYVLFGTYALLGTAYMAISKWAESGSFNKRMLFPAGLALILIVCVPLVAYYFYDQTNLSEVYTAGMPGFDVFGVTYTSYQLPFYLLFLLPVCFSIFYRYPILNLNKWLFILLHVLVLSAACWGICSYWYRNENFQKELLMARAVENEDWEKVVAVARETTTEPTRMMVMYKNLALFRLGRAGDEMFQYREGGATPDAPFPVRLVQVGGKSLYYHYGKANYCYRWCMEDGVVFGWKAEYLKYMAKTALVNREFKVAEKYINILKKTRFHREWAEKYAAYLYHPEAVWEAEEFKPILSMLPKKDQLGSDLSVIEMYLLQSFAYGDSDDPLYQEQTLIAALQMKDIDLFWPKFFKYAQLHLGQRMPLHYQEAAYLYGHLEQKVDISHMPFDRQVVDSYNDFMEFSKQCSGMTEAQMAEVMRPRFGHTFYYFYFLIRGLQTY